MYLHPVQGVYLVPVLSSTLPWSSALNCRQFIHLETYPFYLYLLIFESRHLTSSEHSEMTEHTPTSVDTRNPPFRFLDLPIEVRIQIYRYLLHRQHPDNIVSYCRKKKAFRRTVRNHTEKLCLLHCRDKEDYCSPVQNNSEILRVSRQCHADAMPVLYEDSQFVMHSIHNLRDFANIFLAKIGATNASMIRYLRVYHVFPKVPSTYIRKKQRCNWIIDSVSRVLAACAGLEVFEFKEILINHVGKIDENAKVAITIADGLLSDKGHPSLRRLGQRESWMNGIDRSPRTVSWALISTNNNRLGQWRIDENCVSATQRRLATEGGISLWEEHYTYPLNRKSYANTHMMAGQGELRSPRMLFYLELRRMLLMIKIKSGEQAVLLTATIQTTRNYVYRGDWKTMPCS